MILTIRRKSLHQFGVGFSLILAGILYFSSIAIITEDVSGLNITNVSVIARVNVSNQFPYLYQVRIVHPLDSNGNIDLQAGSNTTVICNGSFSDVNGFDDVAVVNATLYHVGSASASSPDHNSTHYSNTSCGTCSVVAGTGNQNGSCLCQFSVQYHANYGNWQCNMTITDVGLLTGNNQSINTNLNPLIGIAVNNLSIDYGEMSVTETTIDPVPKNVTNVGNVPINVSLRGYGSDNESIGINHTMLCEGGANISFGYQRYSLFESTPFNVMTNLTNQTLLVQNLTIPKRDLNAQYGNSTNVTYWRLQIPLGPTGMCNGTIIFSARDAR